MSPLYRPLYRPAARERAAEWHRAAEFDPLADPRVSTPFDPGLHTADYRHLPAEVVDALHTVEHGERGDGRLIRRRMPLTVMTNGLRRVPLALALLVDQYAKYKYGTPSAFAAPDPARFPDAADPLLPAALAAYDRAWATCGSAVDRFGLVADVVKHLPSGRAAVVVGNGHEGGRLVQALKAKDLDAAGFFTSGVEGNRPKVAVGTLAGLSSPAAAVHACDLVVVLHPIDFLTSSSGVGLRSEPNLVGKPWLGLLPADRTLAPIERDLLVSFFGPFAYHLPAHGRVKRRVLFSVQKFKVADGYDRLVMALAGELVGRGPGVRSRRFHTVALAAGVSGKVAVLARNDRHRRQLERACPATARSRVRVLTPHQLSTAGGIGVLVRADGRDGRPAFAPAELEEAQAARTPLLVIEAVSPNGTTEPAGRVRAYREAGWGPLDAWAGGYSEWNAWVHRRVPGRR